MASIYIAAAAAIQTGVSAYSGSQQSNALSRAGDLQAASAKEALAAQMAQFYQTQQNLKPYMAAGGNALSRLETLTGANGNPELAPLTSPFNPTMQWLEKTPGYQFTLDQGLKGVQNSYAAKGLGSSGAAMRGAAEFSTGLAEQTWQQQFQNDLSAKAQTYNMLSGLTQLGQTSSAGVGNLGAAATLNASNFGTSGAAAQAAGLVGSTNAFTNGLNGAAGSVGNALQLGGLYSYWNQQQNNNWKVSPTNSTAGQSDLPYYA